MKCSSCGTTASGGKFCANCGAALGTVSCPTCGHQPPAGAHFCNQCGSAMGGSMARQGDSGNRLAWWMAGALLVGLILVITYPVYGPARPGASVPVVARPGVGPASVDLSSMTPREAADRLFNRVMTAVAANDSAEVVSFLPMAIRSFELAEPPDADGKFHLVLLRLTGQFNAEALARAEEILSEQPNHLLGLAMAGDASIALGDSVAARAYYRRLLDAYDSEMEKDLLEYSDHAPMFPAMRSTAEALAGND